MIDARILLPTAAAGLPGRRTWFALAALSLLAAGGCVSELDTSYGGMSRSYLPTSVNGVDVLAGMFSAAGHEVSTRRVLLTSSMDEVQTVVWFPNDYCAPSQETCEWFDAWLAGDRRRTLVYVGRNFDAAVTYWNTMASRPGPHQKEMFRRHQRAVAVAASRASHRTPSELQCPWFTIYPGAQIRTNFVSGPWSRAIDVEKAEIELGDSLDPVDRARRLLVDGARVFVWQRIDRDRDHGQLTVVKNGSFLLNLPLVNHEHRKLAGKLIESVGPPGRVVFLESGPGGPPIDPPAGGSALARLFGVWPLNVILLHLAVLGIIFCFARWPIFGRPRLPPAETLSDFSKHVEAVGELLRRTRDRRYAQDQLPAEADAARAAAAGGSMG